jgi:hypothetical protein
MFKRNYRKTKISFVDSNGNLTKTNTCFNVKNPIVYCFLPKYIIQGEYEWFDILYSLVLRSKPNKALTILSNYNINNYIRELNDRKMKICTVEEFIYISSFLQSYSFEEMTLSGKCIGIAPIKLSFKKDLEREGNFLLGDYTNPNFEKIVLNMFRPCDIKEILDKRSLTGVKMPEGLYNYARKVFSMYGYV